MIDVNKTVSMEQAQRQLKSVVEEVKRNRTPFVLTCFGEPQALIVSIEEYEEMQEELALLSNPEHIARIADARAAYAAGEGMSFDAYVNDRHSDE